MFCIGYALCEKGQQRTAVDQEDQGGEVPAPGKASEASGSVIPAAPHPSTEALAGRNADELRWMRTVIRYWREKGRPAGSLPFIQELERRISVIEQNADRRPECFAACTTKDTCAKYGCANHHAESAPPTEQSAAGAGTPRVLTLLEELDVEGSLVPNRRGELYRLAAQSIRELATANEANTGEAAAMMEALSYKQGYASGAQDMRERAAKVCGDMADELAKGRAVASARSIAGRTAMQLCHAIKKLPTEREREGGKK